MLGATLRSAQKRRMFSRNNFVSVRNMPGIFGSAKPDVRLPYS
jgi:hypothetical protein